ncbi:uncharacterized protein LOC142557128 isoform X2 [Dermacentor variabilis]|uniref:uncharacterized protein LOC142557128 isoform X2 n=1 Tax=Dermacentor variabilis TaxID=34621 RepID=UPI003F5C98A6
MPVKFFQLLSSAFVMSSKGYKVSKHWKRTCIHGVIWRHCADATGVATQGSVQARNPPGIGKSGSIWWLSQVRFIDLQLGCKLDFCMHLSHVVNVAL